MKTFLELLLLAAILAMVLWILAGTVTDEGRPNDLPKTRQR